ncbi:fimbrial protein (plasmid) [Klebsiella michiganensis]|uniref:fimbrial protein n=1 Tax=Klebsiella michiganensis TaxID=1134687 RepID=UPI00265A8C00|nr:fimbrial protein [Klebsiella michiganensis]WKJ95769.1 fimbrial protein [Klebsiella michiganensis]WKK00967.1 fimbrial protein [Klebsiella michiganensis]WKK02885.1 fimbrial protein [Klebsiella michiganensis]WKK06994.1 fimbrial protein [Klebsiella michiganensis]
MQKKLSFLSMATSIALILSVNANAADGTITISGEVTDTTCDIAVNGGTADATVTLPTVSASTLTTSGETAGTTPFSIALSGCSGTTLNTATTWFESGSNVDSTTGRLTNTGTAENVQVQLLNSDLGTIVAGGTSGSTDQNDVAVDISGGSGTLNYYAQYYALGASSAGTVLTSVDYTIVYE